MIILAGLLISTDYETFLQELSDPPSYVPYRPVPGLSRRIPSRHATLLQTLGNKIVMNGTRHNNINANNIKQPEIVHPYLNKPYKFSMYRVFGYSAFMTFSPKKIYHIPYLYFIMFRMFSMFI